MPENFEQEVEKRIAALPPAVRDAIFESDLSERIRSIGTAHKLHIDQMSQLEDQVMLVMLGFTKPEEFAGELVAGVNLSAEESKAVADEVNTKIFLAIRQLMQKSIPTTPAPTSPTPIPAPISTPQAAPTPKPAAAHPADMMLSQKTVTTAPPATPKPAAATPAQPSAPAPVAKPEPPKPGPYKADPYREPIQ